MTDEQLAAACATIGSAFVELYGAMCDKVPKAVVITGMTGALAACAMESGMGREGVAAALNSAFDDIEAGP